MVQYRRAPSVSRRAKPPLCKGRWHAKRDGGIVTEPRNNPSGATRMFFGFAREIVGVQPTKKNSARRIASRTAHPLHRGALLCAVRRMLFFFGLLFRRRQTREKRCRAVDGRFVRRTLYGRSGQRRKKRGIVSPFRSALFSPFAQPLTAPAMIPLMIYF